MTVVAPRRRGRRTRPGGHERVAEVATPEPAGSLAACERSSGDEAESPARVPSLFDGGGGEPTLDELVSGVWRSITARERVPCPLCGGAMTPVYAAHAQPIAGRCEDCGTTLG